MSDSVFTPVHISLTYPFCERPRPASQPEIYDNAQKTVDFVGTFSEKTQPQRGNRSQPHGWMHPTDNFLPMGGIVLDPAHFPATPLPIRPAPAPVTALPVKAPTLPPCTTWASRDGLTRGTVQRQDWGVTLMASTGVSGCRATASITLQPHPARELAHVMLTVFDAALQDRSTRYSVQWGDPNGLHGRVTLHAFGIDVTATNGSLDCCVETVVQFRDIHAVHEVGTLLFGQADAHDVEFGEGDAA